MAFLSWLDSTFTITRTATVKDSITHIAKTTTITTQPTACRIGRSTGNVIQTSPQAVYTQSLRLYTLIDADIKAGDIIKVYDVKNVPELDLTTLNYIKYTVGNSYKASKHHLEVDITLKQEV